MLATTGVPTNLVGWSVEPKLDGWRARVLVDADDLRVLTRNGNDITANTPELQRLATIGLRMVLDGELITGAGRLSDFYAVAGRLAGRPRASSSPVTFAPTPSGSTAKTLPQSPTTGAGTRSTHSASTAPPSASSPDTQAKTRSRSTRRATATASRASSSRTSNRNTCPVNAAPPGAR